MVEERLRRMGLHVTRKEVRQLTLGGGVTRESRVSAYSGDGRIKVVYSEYSDGEKRLSILLTGSMATKDREATASRLGGRVDFDEKERLYAVFKPRDKKRAEEIIDEMLRGTST